MGYFVNYED
jgi:MFS family permease